MRRGLPKLIVLFLMLSVLNINATRAGENHIQTRGIWNNDLTKDMNLSDASFASFLGEMDTSATGISVDGVGDVNGDGIDDMLIGASFNAEHASGGGQTYLVLGDTSGWSQQTSLGEADASFFGPSMSMSGACVAKAGDVNGDGYHDFLIGAYSDMEGGLQAGKAYLILGKGSGWHMDTDLATAYASFIGQSEHEMCGYSVSGVGNVNGDGYDDFLIGTTNGIAYLFFGRTNGWGTSRPLSTADVTFVQENVDDRLGFDLAPAGDVNGDGYDDIILSANGNDEGGDHAGQTYVVFGRPSGWPSNMVISNADASFIGENEGDNSGYSVAGVGDVNWDGFDDILIGAPSNNEGGYQAGKIYLILGKGSGWSMDTDLDTADASFIGENSEDDVGDMMSCGGDLNGDGLSDFLIGVRDNGEVTSEAGQTYLIYGRSSGWGTNVSLSDSDASFHGEYFEDRSGCSVANAGDVDGDGLTEVMIGAAWNDDAGSNAGKVYLIKGTGGTEPLEVYSLEAFIDPALTQPASVADNGDVIYLEMRGTDGNTTHTDLVRVNVTFSKSTSRTISIYLRETDVTTGIYRGSYMVPMWSEYFERISFSSYKDPTKYDGITVDYPYRPITVSSVTIHPDPGTTTTRDKFDLGDAVYFKSIGVDANPTKVDKDFINLSSNKNSSFAPLLVLTETGTNTGTYIGSTVVSNTMVYFENITAKSVRNPMVTAKFMVHTPVQIRSLDDVIHAKEDIVYSVSFYNFGYNQATWDVSFDASWLEWDPQMHVLHGEPNNLHPGNWDVGVLLSDPYGNEDRLDFQISVENAVPIITTEPVTEVYEDQPYSMDFDCDDDGLGTITWHLSTSAEWLSFDPASGVLSGTPRDYEVETKEVTVSVDDGNDGWNSTTFDLVVVGVNDRPEIITTDIRSVTEGERYYRDYEVLDPDVGDNISWSLVTDSTWLSMDPTTGELEGTPEDWDVGTFVVNVTATDIAGEWDSHEFLLTVENKNDRPIWTLVPEDNTILHGQLFTFDVDAVDPDPGAVVEYTIRTEPESDMGIDPGTGVIEWVADVNVFEGSMSFVLEVTVKASDGEMFSLHNFELNVVPTGSPVCHLISPVENSKTPSAYSLLRWEGIDPENETLTYKVYLDRSEAFVSGKRPDCIRNEEIAFNELNITGLQPGDTYYWTVIPHDGGTEGPCTNGPFSFKVNNAPTLRSVSDQKAFTGSELSIKVSGTDADAEDGARLRYSLYKAPKGMRIDEGTGRVTWTPSDDQTGSHEVVLRLTDGVDTASVTFAIEVEEGERQAPWIIIVLVALFIVMIGLVAFIVISKVKRSDEKGKDVKTEEVDEESAWIAKEMEAHRKEMDWEKEHHREGASNVSEITAPSNEGTSVISSVPLTVEEAHAKDRSSAPKTYEELYGIPAPAKTDEDLTTKELKDQISEQIRELEKGEGP